MGKRERKKRMDGGKKGKRTVGKRETDSGKKGNGQWEKVLSAPSRSISNGP